MTLLGSHSPLATPHRKGSWEVECAAGRLSVLMQQGEKWLQWTTGGLNPGLKPTPEPPSSISSPRVHSPENNVIPSEVPPSMPRSVVPGKWLGGILLERVPFYPSSSWRCEKGFCPYCLPDTSLSFIPLSHTCSQSLGVTTNVGVQDDLD